MDAKEVIKAHEKNIREIALRLSAVRQPGDLRIIQDLLIAMSEDLRSFQEAWQKEVDDK